MAKETEPPSRETLDLLRPRLRAHYLHTPAPEAMIQIAVDLLLEGIETPAVLRCACMSRVDDRDDIRDWFYEAMAELGVPKMTCLLYTSPSPRDQRGSRMPSSA